jgi:hypothetical protein
MRLLYDGMIYNLQVTGGITRYFANLIGRLPSHFIPSLVVGRNGNNQISPRIESESLRVWEVTL